MREEDDQSILIFGNCIFAAKTSKACCRLPAVKRWAVTGTPIQNKELDLFSLVRFLRCTPFDEWTVWKQWVDKSPMGQQRMNTLVKSLLLRRTKDQKSSVTGQQIVPLPEKETITAKIHHEKLVKLKQVKNAMIREEFNQLQFDQKTFYVDSNKSSGQISDAI